MTEAEKEAARLKDDSTISLENLDGDPIIESIDDNGGNPIEYQDITKLEDNYKNLLAEKNGANYDKEGNLLDKDNKVILTKDEVTNSFTPKLDLFNNNGDLVDAKGTVLKTKADIEAERLAAIKEGEEGEEEIPELYNAAGDLIKPDGTVIKTKAEIDSNINEDDGAVTVILKKYGIKPVDEAGQPLVFEDTIEDFEKAANLVVQARLKEQENNFLDSQPKDVKEYYLHRANGNAPEDFFKRVEFDVDNIVLEKDKPEILKKVIKEGAIARGYNEETADKMVQRSEAVQALFEDAGVELQFMQSSKEAKNAEYEANLAAQKAANDATIKETRAAITAIIQNKNIDGLKIIDADIPAFTDYLLKDNGKGSAYQQALEALTREQEMKLAYWMFKGYDVTKLVKEVADKKTVLKFREANKASNSTNNTRKPTKEVVGTEEITLDAIT